MARMKTPSNGPLVADVTNMDDSITPDSNPTPKLMPIIMQPYTMPIHLMTHSC